MRHWTRWLTAALALAGVFLLMPAGRAQAADYSWIRVKLSVGNATYLSIGVKGNYFINENGASFSGGTLSVRANGDGTLTVSHSSKNDLYTGKTISVMRENVDRTAGHLALNSRYYLGHLTLKATSANYIQAVNNVPLAHYLYGVVGNEMSNTFPLEALRAQAVAAKCYVLTGLSPTSEYDIGDTSTDQVYKGYTSSDTNVINAVDSTLDKFLTIGGSMLRTYYAASNGGETKLVTQAWSDRGTNAGYAVSIDDYDFANPNSLKETAYFPLNGAGTIPSKVASFLAGKASTALGKAVTSVDAILSVEAHTPRYSGVLRDMTKGTATLMVTTGGSISSGGGGGGLGFGLDPGGTPVVIDPGTSEQVTVTVNFQLSELLTGGVFTNSSLRTYWGEAVSGGYQIYHVRWGHGVGMSQRGAQQRAAAGQNYTSILNFYYPGATLSTIAVAAPTNPVKPVVDTPDPELYPGLGVTTASVNFREGPSVSYQVYELLAKGKQVILYSYASGWYYAYYNGKFGYLSADYVKWQRLAKESELPATTPIITPDPSISPSPSPDGTGTGGGDLPIKTVTCWSGYVTGSGVNFRDKPNTSTSAVLGKLAKNTELLLFSNSGDWYSARCGTQDGYISASYVKITGEMSLEMYDPDHPSLQQPAVSLGTGETTGSVNFREGPATSYKKITQLKKGTTMTLYALENGWYEVDVNGTHGFVSAQYVKVVSTPSGGGSQTVNATGVTSATVNFRDYPSTTTGNVYEKLSKGVQVTILAQNAEWYYVSYGQRQGYLYKAYVKVTNAGTAGIPAFDATPALVIPTPTPTATPGTTPTPTPTPGVSASPSPSATPGNSGVVIEQTYLRDYPGTQGAQVSVLPVGTQMTIYSAEGSWYLVMAGGMLGYVNASCVVRY